MKPKYTPWPWKIRLNPRGDIGECHILGADGFDIVGIATNGLPKKRKLECLAASHLIAAAPELLEWAKDLSQQIRRHEGLGLRFFREFADPADSLRMLEKAIDKAEGK